MNRWMAKSAIWNAAAALALISAGAVRGQETDADKSTPPPDDPIAALIAAETSDHPTDGPSPAVDQEPAAILSDDADSAPPSTDEIEATVPAPPAGVARPPMWRVADADSEVWLLGTFNILPENLEWRTNALLKAADLAETLWLEIEVDRADAAEKTMQILSRRGVNPPGVTLSSLLSPEDAARLAEVAERLDLPMDAVERMRPWQAFLILNVQFIASQGYDPGSGIQTSLLAEGRARGRHVVFLETIEQQLGAFSALDPETEKNLLSIALRDWDKQKKEFEALLEAWRVGDAAAVDRLANDTMRTEAPKAYEALIVARNKAWTEKIASSMKGSGRALIVVGAANLVGADSVPALLRAKGFEVTRYGAE